MEGFTEKILFWANIVHRRSRNSEINFCVRPGILAFLMSKKKNIELI